MKTLGERGKQMTRTQKPEPEFLLARLVVHRADLLTTRQRKQVAKWIRMQASALESSDKFGRRYTARYFINWRKP